MPGLEWRGSGRIAVAIDTSGSMAGDDLAAMLAEVDALRRSGADELVVVQFDAEIQAVAEFTPWQQVDEKIGSTASMRMMGRGGTDLRLPFGWVEAEAERGRPPTMLIVCTDGFGPLPKGRPDGLEVLFVLTPGHAMVAPELGMQIVMPRGASRAR